MQVLLRTSSAIGALVSARVLVGKCVLGGMHKLLCLEVSLWPLAKALWNGFGGHKWWQLDPNKLSSSVLAQTHRDLSEGAILLAADGLARAKPLACRRFTTVVFSVEPIGRCLGRSATRGRPQRGFAAAGEAGGILAAVAAMSG